MEVEAVATLLAVHELATKACAYSGFMAHDDEEISHLRDRLDDFGGAIDALRAQLEAAEAECARLRADAERLDWLAQGFKTCTVYMSGQHPWEPSHKVRGLRGPSFRAAIDAAMARTKEQQA